VANILVLDDERIVRNFVAIVLHRNQNSIRQAGTPDEAERICRERPLDLLVVDVSLSDGRSGIAFAFQLLRAQPSVKCLFMSGLPVEDWPEKDQASIATLPPHSYAVLTKPMSPEVLLKTVNELKAKSQAFTPGSS
jgi:DNA-binding NtrC family response regulator